MNRKERIVKDAAIRDLVRRDAQAAQVAADEQVEVKWGQDK